MAASYIWYESFSEALEELDDTTQLQIRKAIDGYALRGEEPELTGAAKAVFVLIKPQLDANKKRRENGRKGGAPDGNGNAAKQPKTTEAEPRDNQKQPKTTKAEPRDNQKQPKTTKAEPRNNQKQPNVNVNVNANANANVNDKEKEISPNGDTKKSSRFSPPTVPEVRAYCGESGYDIDAERFVNFYESKGWMVGKNKMKNWKAAARNWAKSEKARPRGDPRKEFEQREYTPEDRDRRKFEIVAEMEEAAGG